MTKPTTVPKLPRRWPPFRRDPDGSLFSQHGKLRLDITPCIEGGDAAITAILNVGTPGRPITLRGRSVRVLHEDSRMAAIANVEKAAVAIGLVRPREPESTR